MKKLTIFIVLLCLFSYLGAQDKGSENLSERIEKFQKDFFNDFKLNDLEKFQDFTFSQEDMGNLQQRIEEWQSNIPEIDQDMIDNWKEKSEKFSKDLAMNLPDLSNEFSYSFPESFDYRFESDEVYETQQTNDQLFNKLSDIKGVEVVYISKSLLGMAANMDIPGMDVNGINIKNIMSKLESLQIFSSEQSGAVKKLKSESEKLVKNGKYETLMFVKDEESKTVFYMNKINNQKAEMLMISEEPNEISIIRFTGSFTVRDLQELTKDNKKKDNKKQKK